MKFLFSWARSTKANYNWFCSSSSEMKNKTGDFNCRAWITLPSGKRIYAKDYGFKCFPIGGKRKATNK